VVKHTPALPKKGAQSAAVWQGNPTPPLGPPSGGLVTQVPSSAFDASWQCEPAWQAVQAVPPEPQLALSSEDP
jgi:hypothetical protein